MTSKSKVLFVLFSLPIVLLVILSAYRKQKLVNHTAKIYDEKYSSVSSGWGGKHYVPLYPLGVFAQKFSSVKTVGRELINEQQFIGLTNSLVNWFLAYSSGVKENFITFRFPSGVEWRWKNDALTTMSNYFSSGMIFSSPDIQDSWIRKYGSPDRLTNFAPYAEISKSWTHDKIAAVRARWEAKYGTGNASVVSSTNTMETWSSIANDHAGGNWFSNYWTGVCIEEGIIKVSSHSTVPEPLENFRYLNQQAKDNGYGVSAWFPNQGYSRMDKANTSFAEWGFNYNDLIREHSSLLVADAFFFVNCSPPDDPQPMMLRLVFISEANKWVPTEMVQCNIVNTRFRLPFF